MTPLRTHAMAWAAAMCLGFALPAARAAASGSPTGDPGDLSLEELLQVDVQTASRKSQRLQDVAAAVFVITRDDIERSGATSIPEALRLAPGVQVARMANNRWAVTARGFNGRFANKLLVLMDGRSIYSPLFSGVLWETEDTLLEDIDRIEVIRGPGASLWGANAVNGVINILTRKARDTAGTLAVAALGTEDRGLLALRHGLTAGDGNVRVWGKAFARDRSVTLAGQPGNDDWHETRAGFRGDWTIDSTRRLTVSGGAHRSRTSDTWLLPDLTSPTGQAPTNLKQRASGAHLLARHEWTGADGGEAALQGYIEHTDFGVAPAFNERRSTIDLDFQHRPRLGTRHDVIWGLGYRSSKDRISSGSVLAVAPEKDSWQLISAFAQDDITVVPETFHVVLGTRIEHNSYTGFEPQPNLRLNWTPTPQRTIWAAWSRAVRTPSRAERSAQIDLQVPQPGLLVRNAPDPANLLGNEVVRALELGWRQQFDSQVSLDVALFHNRYQRLRGGARGPVTFEALPVPHAVQNISPSNGLDARTQGAEIALDWHVSPTWRLQPIWTAIHIDARPKNADPFNIGTAAEYNNNAPRRQWSVRSSTTLADRSQVDLWLRRVGALPAANPGDTTIPAYTTLDLRYAWRARSGFELSVTGQNLLDPQHPEFVPDLLNAQTLQLQRAVVVKAKWQF